MSDWVHCNKCSTKYHPQATFALAECGHIFCQKCVERMRASKKCLVCGKVSNVMALNKDVDKGVLEYFSPLETLFKKSLESAGKNSQRFTTSTPVCPPSDSSITLPNVSMLSSIPPHVGITPSKDSTMAKMYSGPPRRNPFFSSGSSQRSSAQRVPLYSQLQEPPMMNRNPNIMRSLEELRRSGKFH